MQSIVSIQPSLQVSAKDLLRFLVLYIVIEVRGHFRSHFLHACLTKKFDACKLDGEASSSLGMVKFIGRG